MNRALQLAEGKARALLAWANATRRREFWIWAGAIAACGAIAFAWDRANLEAVAAPEAPPASADTFIPAGFVLVPIQVSNFESLDSILGREGVVDLFVPAPEGGGGRARRVAERVRILRSPQDPSHFAVLAPAADSHRLVSQTGSFFVAVQNPTRRGAVFEKPPAVRGPSRIHVEKFDDGSSSESP